jgi:hypothetical protein
MKNLEKIIDKYSNLQYNENNYGVGGGLDGCKFASNRHEDALNDIGKLTLGKTVQMFKKATGFDTDFVKKVILYEIPNLEWHHAGMLPKQYGGGMKKTYFVNAVEIVHLALNWQRIVEQFEISNNEKRIVAENQKNKEQLQQEFLEKNATRIVRTANMPQFFYEVDREMNGKYGWFSSYGKSYKLTEYYTGWSFDSIEKYNEFMNLK